MQGQDCSIWRLVSVSFHWQSQECHLKQLHTDSILTNTLVTTSIISQARKCSQHIYFNSGQQPVLSDYSDILLLGDKVQLPLWPKLVAQGMITGCSNCSSTKKLQVAPTGPRMVYDIKLNIFLNSLTAEIPTACITSSIFVGFQPLCLFINKH